MKTIAELIVEEFKKMDFSNNAEYKRLLKEKDKIHNKFMEIFPYKEDLRVIKTAEELLKDINDFYYKKIVFFTINYIWDMYNEVNSKKYLFIGQKHEKIFDLFFILLWIIREGSVFYFKLRH